MPADLGDVMEKAAELPRLVMPWAVLAPPFMQNTASPAITPALTRRRPVRRWR